MAPIIISLPSLSECYVTDSHFALLTCSQAEADADCEVETELTLKLDFGRRRIFR